MNFSYTRLKLRADVSNTKKNQTERKPSMPLCRTPSWSVPQESALSKKSFHTRAMPNWLTRHHCAKLQAYFLWRETSHPPSTLHQFLEMSLSCSCSSRGTLPPRLPHTRPLSDRETHVSKLSSYSCSYTSWNVTCWYQPLFKFHWGSIEMNQCE